MTSSIALNVGPATEAFCPDPAAPSSGVIRFPGGFQLEAQVDPTKGIPGNCALTIDLMGKVAPALAPFMPLFRILDFVAHLAQCFLLMKDCLTNPFKIPDLVGCLPGLVGKLNQLLALIPVFPQGIASILQFVVDVVRFTISMLDCVLQQLEALQAELVEIARLTALLNQTEDETTRENLQTLLGCATANVEASASSVLAALGPIARLLCTVRTLLSIVPGGREIATRMAFPDPTTVTNLSAASAALQSVRDTLEGIVSVLAALGGPIPGFSLDSSAPSFSCPLDSASSTSSSSEPPPEPSISNVTLGGLLVPPATIPQASPGGPAVQLVVNGAGFVEDSQVFFNTAQVQDVQFGGPNQLVANVPADVLTNTGNFYLMVVNVPAGATEQFSGLSETPGGTGSSGVLMSDQYEVEVA